MPNKFTRKTAFNSDLEYWIGRINILANIVYKEELKIKDNIEPFIGLIDKRFFGEFKNKYTSAYTIFAEIKTVFSAKCAENKINIGHWRTKTNGDIQGVFGRFDGK